MRDDGIVWSSPLFRDVGALNFRPLTEIELAQIQADRALDQKVAEFVMGLGPMWHQKGNWAWVEGEGIWKGWYCADCYPDGNPTSLIGGDISVKPDRCLRYSPSNYSTDIAKAHQVIEKLSDRFWLRLESPYSVGDPWLAGFTPLSTTGWNGRPDFEASDPSPSRAICLAALEAMEKR